MAAIIINYPRTFRREPAHQHANTQTHLAARVEADVPLHQHGRQLPLAVGDVIGRVALGAVHDQVDVEAVVGPGGEPQRAVLPVEGEVAHVDGTGRLEDEHAQPRHVAVAGDDDVAADGGEVRGNVRAAMRHRGRKQSVNASAIAGPR